MAGYSLILRAAAAGVVLAAALAGSAEAEYIYTYTGHTFSYDGGGPVVTNVSGYFDLSYALSPDTTYNLAPGTAGAVTGYDFTDGETVLDLANYSATSTDAGDGPAGFTVTTGASGQIVSWYLNIYSTGANITTCEGSACAAQFSNTAYDDTNVYFNYDAYTVDNPGTWTETVVPEPPGGPLFAAGLLGVLTLAARRRAVSR